MLTSREQGSASVEFLSLGVLLLVPLIYLVLILGKFEAASFAVEGAARHAARLAVETTSGPARTAAINRSVAQALRDFDFDPAAAAVTVRCQPASCQGAGTKIEVSVVVAVALPLMPDWLVGNRLGVLPVGASATYSVSRFAGADR